MFGHNGGSGGFGPLWLLVSIVIGASLNSMQCSRVQPQPLNLTLDNKVFTTQYAQDSAASYGHRDGATPNNTHRWLVENMESRA